MIEQVNISGTSIEGMVAQELDRPVKSSRPFNSSHNAEIFLVDMEDGSRFVVKVAKDSGANLALEGWMLEYLKEKSALPLPEVFCSKDNLLIMSYLPDCGRIDDETQYHAADLLAALHNIKADKFGFERDTLIGPLRQPNPWEDDWLKFFGEHRLLYMAKEAFEEKRIDDVMLKRVERLVGKLNLYLDAPSEPCLLHGDVWDGNILALPGQVVGFIDPALYYGDPEIELAFTTLFGTFGQAFFESYQKHRPIAPGFFEERRDLYNIYPLLVHVRLYGDMYMDRLDSTLSSFV